MTQVVCLILIGAGIVLCLVRMLKGPSTVDRAVAVDTSATVTTALLVMLAAVFKRYVYLDVALVYAVLTFIGAVAIARYLERGL
ncbi:MAG: cation:proton antiporter [Planctomycetes bacterium DG_58]|nr:MAG: cation:proton antiporter [Planctomycetes bacterium DG_58]KPL03394.1 MAG: cation:proton antiporter [Planctomycetes bacterium SM23_65]